MFKALGNYWTTITGLLTAITGAVVQFDAAPEGWEGLVKLLFVVGIAVFGFFAKDGQTGSAPGATK